MEKSGNPPPYGSHPQPHQFPPLPQQQYPPPPQQYPLPPEQYPPPPAQPQTTVVVGSPTYTAGAAVVLGGTAYGPSSQSAYCPHCRTQVLTKVEVVTATKTHLYALLLCMFACWPCVCIPYCVDSCRNKNHHCPNCGAYLGTYNQ